VSNRRLLSFLAVVALAGCGGVALRNAPETGPGAMARPAGANFGHSWMLPDRKRTTLIDSTDHNVAAVSIGK
jgi:uncharacterized protein YceK